MNEKLCSRCNEILPADKFHKDARTAGGLFVWCKACRSEDGRRRRAEKVAEFSGQPTVPERPCTRCGAVKEASAFALRPVASDGLASWCKECHRAFSRERRRERYAADAEFRERAKRNQKRSRHNRPRDTPEAARQREQQRLRWQRIRSAPETAERVRQRRADYYQRIKDRPAHKEARRLVEARRRAQKRGAGADRLSRQEWASIVDEFGGCCAYCGVSGDLSIDHVIPLALGGDHAAANVVPACLPCNQRKQKRTPRQAGMVLRDRSGRGVTGGGRQEPARCVHAIEAEFGLERPPR